MNAALDEAMQGELEPLGAKPGTARRHAYMQGAAWAGHACHGAARTPQRRPSQVNLFSLRLLCLNRTWKRVVVEGGVGPESEGEEVEVSGGEPGRSPAQAAPDRRLTRSRGGRPSLHSEAVETGGLACCAFASVCFRLLGMLACCHQHCWLNWMMQRCGPSHGTCRPATDRGPGR